MLYSSEIKTTVENGLKILDELITRAEDMKTKNMGFAYSVKLELQILYDKINNEDRLGKDFIKN